MGISKTGFSKIRISKTGFSKIRFSRMRIGRQKIRKRREFCLSAAALALFFLLYYGGLLQLSELAGGCGGTIRVMLDSSPIEAAAAEALIEERIQLESDNADETAGAGGGAADGDAVTAGGRKPRALYMAWTRERDVPVSNPDLQRSLFAPVIYFAGDTGFIFDPVSENGCAVPEETARRLWRTASQEEIMGAVVRIGGTDYTVEKVLPAGSFASRWGGEAIIARADVGARGRTDSSSGDGGSLEPLRFSVLDIITQDPKHFSVDELLAAGGLKSDMVIRYDELAEMIAALRLLPLWGAVLYTAAGLMLSGRRQGRCRKKESLRERRRLFFGRVSIPLPAAGVIARIAPPAAAAGLVVLTTWLAGPPFAVPGSFLPTRWSDFSFWSRTAEATANAIRTYLSLEVSGPDFRFRMLALRAVLCFLGQTALLIFVLRRGTARPFSAPAAPAQAPDGKRAETASPSPEDRGRPQGRPGGKEQVNI